MKITKHSLWVYGVPAVLAAALVWLATVRGAGVGGDATIYLTSAQNLAKGIGLGLLNPDGTFRLIPYFPPFFPLVLSVFQIIQLDAILAARWLHLLLFGLTIFLILITMGRVIHSKIMIGFTGIILAASPVLVPAFSWVMAEPLSIFLGTLAILILIEALQKSKPMPWMAVSAGLAGLSTLTRYGAIVYAATGVLLCMFFIKESFWLRVRSAVFYGLISILPVSIWALIDLSLTRTVSSRSFPGWDGLWERCLSYFVNLKSVILFWIIPESWMDQPFYPAWMNTLILLVFLAGMIAGTVFFLKKTPKASPLYLLGTSLTLFCVLYIFMTLIISMLTYPPITIGTRMFSPCYLMAIWLLMLMAYAFWQSGSNQLKIKTLILLGLLGLGLWNGWRTARIVETARSEGLGFQSVAWQESDLINYVRTLPASQSLVTNEEMALFFLTQRSSYPLAEIFSDEPLKVFTRYGESPFLDEGQRQFANQGAYLVLFDSITQQLSGLYQDQTPERLKILIDGLEVVYQGEDGAIYRISGNR